MLLLNNTNICQVTSLPRCCLKRLFTRSMWLFAVNSNEGFREGVGFVERYSDCVHTPLQLTCPSSLFHLRQPSLCAPGDGSGAAEGITSTSMQCQHASKLVYMYSIPYSILHTLYMSAFLSSYIRGDRMAQLHLAQFFSHWAWKFGLIGCPDFPWGNFFFEILLGQQVLSYPIFLLICLKKILHPRKTSFWHLPL